MAEEASSGSSSTTKKSTAKKSTAKKSTSKKSSGTKSTAKKSTAKKSSAKKSSGRTASAPRAEASRPMSGSRIAQEAARRFAEVSSKQVEGVSGFRRDDDGWVVELDVLELRRVPETTDVLGSYEVEVDGSGEIEGYRRVHRYVRGQAEDAT